jgi:heme exporter protein D
MPEFQFQSLAEFLSMGGHAVYVWWSYGIFAAIIAFNILQPLLAKKRILRQLQARLVREEARSASGFSEPDGRKED